MNETLKTQVSLLPELSENSLLIIDVDVGNLPKVKVKQYLNSIKKEVEQILPNQKLMFIPNKSIEVTWIPTANEDTTIFIRGDVSKEALEELLAPAKVVILPKDSDVRVETK